MPKALISLAAAVGLFAAASAEARVYECQLAQNRINWIPTTLAISINDETSEVIVHDNLTLALFGKPVTGELDTSNGRRETVKWRLDEINNGRGQFTAKMLYRATIIRGTNAITVYAKPVGYPNDFRGSGRCTLR